jgi:hypothetical protein
MEWARGRLLIEPLSYLSSLQYTFQVQYHNLVYLPVQQLCLPLPQTLSHDSDD